MQHFAGVVDSALDHVVLCDGHLVGFLQDGFGVAAGDRSELGDFPADAVHLVLGHLLENLAADLIAQQHHQNGRLANAVEFG